MHSHHFSASLTVSGNNLTCVTFEILIIAFMYLFPVNNKPEVFKMLRLCVLGIEPGTPVLIELLVWTGKCIHSFSILGI